MGGKHTAVADEEELDEVVVLGSRSHERGGHGWTFDGERGRSPVGGRAEWVDRLHGRNTALSFGQI